MGNLCRNQLKGHCINALATHSPRRYAPSNRLTPYGARPTERGVLSSSSSPPLPPPPPRPRRSVGGSGRPAGRRPHCQERRRFLRSQVGNSVEEREGGSGREGPLGQNGARGQETRLRRSESGWQFNRLFVGPSSGPKMGPRFGPRVNCKRSDIQTAEIAILWARNKNWSLFWPEMFKVY